MRGTTFRGGLPSVQFLSAVMNVAVVGETEENPCSVDEVACVEVKRVVGHGPWYASVSHSLLQSA